MGFQCKRIARNTLAKANELRDWRIYADFARLYVIDQAKAFFVIRAQDNQQYRRLYSTLADKTTGVQSDQTIVLTGPLSRRRYPDRLRRVRYYDAERDKRLVFLTNDFELPALTIAMLYKARWQIEQFFKWLKQHLRIKSFFGTSENAVKTQVWIAVSVYVLVAILEKRLALDQSLYRILQILGLVLFDKRPILQVFSEYDYTIGNALCCNQLKLFDF